ncbi:flagellin [Rheinheimera sp.]|uniref:flagellin N-terminal helical domain-containing protein n=1 Tax=Rheinheimera sp. TaxID=1869214 RepID=UPI003AF5532D
MALSIQSNAAATTIRNQLNRTNDGLGVALERLGTGFRINSAKDDAAGLQIASRLSAQLVGQETAISNTSNASAMLKTAEGAFDEMTNIVFRMKELATQSADGTYADTERTAMQAEFLALNDEMINIMTNTSFGAGTNLLSATGKFGVAGGVTFQIGASAGEDLLVEIDTEVGLINTALGAAGASAVGNVGTQAGGNTAMGTLDTLLTNISTARSALGASMNRLDHTANNLSNMAENTGNAKSQLMDADFAKETSNMTKQQLLLNSGISVLSTANSTTQMVSQLLR